MVVVVSSGVVAGSSGAASSGAAPKLIWWTTWLAAMVAASEVVGSGAAAMTHWSTVQSTDPNFSFTTMVNDPIDPLASALRKVAPVAVLQSAGPV